MALSRPDRFRLKSQLLDALSSEEWSFQKINLLLREFELEPIDGNWQGPGIEDVIAPLDDQPLTELYGIVFGIDPREVENAVESTAGEGNWKHGYARVFISHSAIHKSFVGEVASELAVVGIHGFVAHDSMEYTKPWQEQIERGLRSMQAFVALVHPEFNDSAWCHQEVGWALGRRVPHYAVRIGTDPAGFIGRDQWPTGYDKTPQEVAAIVSSWVSSVPDLSASVVDGLFAALEEAGNYMDAGATAERIAALGTLTPEQFDRLDAIYLGNDQLYGGTLPSRALRPLYARHQRELPRPS